MYVAAILQLLGGPLYDNFQRIGCLRLSCSIMDKCCSGFHILQTPSRTFTSSLSAVEKIQHYSQRGFSIWLSEIECCFIAN